MNMFTRSDDGAEEFRLYHYDPTVVGAVIFTILFLATTLLHSWQLIRGRSWFVIPLTLGGFCKFICHLNAPPLNLTSPLLQSRLLDTLREQSLVMRVPIGLSALTSYKAFSFSSHLRFMLQRFIWSLAELF